MTKLQTWLERSCGALGLQVDLDFTLDCADNRKVQSVARIRGVGAANGMLIFSDYAEVEDHLECLRLYGYGFSVLSEPGDTELFDIDSVQEMFSDWGWAGAAPSSLTDEPTQR